MQRDALVGFGIDDADQLATLFDDHLHVVTLGSDDQFTRVRLDVVDDGPGQQHPQDQHRGGDGDEGRALLPPWPGRPRERLQGRGRFRRGLVALGRILGHYLRQHAGEFRGHFWTQLADWLGGPGAVGVELARVEPPGNGTRPASMWYSVQPSE